MKSSQKILTLIIIVIASLSCGESHAGSKAKTATVVPDSLMRFHCAKDTSRIDEILVKGKEKLMSVGLDSCRSNPGTLVSFYAHLLEGTPYVAHTLEGESEKLTINIDQLDCTTFVETLYALVRTTLEGDTTWRGYARNLEDLRYRDGKMGDYSTRLHYICDWIINNGNRGNIEDITPRIKGYISDSTTINFMTTHRASYRSLKSDSTQFKKIQEVEKNLNDSLRAKGGFPYIDKKMLNDKAVKSVVQEGDFVGLVTTIDGLDISHLGIVVKDEKGNLVLLDASSRAMKVVREQEDMHTMLKKNKGNKGVRFFRMKRK